jgi:hypothetical protein
MSHALNSAKCEQAWRTTKQQASIHVQEVSHPPNPEPNAFQLYAIIIYYL